MNAGYGHASRAPCGWLPARSLKTSLRRQLRVCAAGRVNQNRREQGQAPRTTARRPSPPDDLSGQRRIRRGQNEIDARIDLHGHTQDTAHREVVDFILRQAGLGARCVLVITGKGRLGTGVLRARLFDWIADPDLRPFIAGYATAHPRHGGSGAVYLFLRSAKR
jgi:DNA-nicking Smr family endonuclease